MNLVMLIKLVAVVVLGLILIYSVYKVLYRVINSEKRKTILIPLYNKNDDGVVKQIGFCSVVNREGRNIVIALSENLSKYKDLSMKSLLFKKGETENNFIYSSDFFDTLQSNVKSKLIKAQEERVKNDLVSNKYVVQIKKEKREFEDGFLFSVNYFCETKKKRLKRGCFNDVIFDFEKINISLDDLDNIVHFKIGKKGLKRGRYNYIELTKEEKLKIEMVLNVDVVDYEGVYIQDKARTIGNLAVIKG